MEGEPTGKWYWRVQAGVTDSHLVLLPLSQPPNPLLTSPPAPLSHAMPAHSTKHNATDSAVVDNNEETGIAGKIKHLFRRGSSSAPPNERRTAPPVHNPTQSTNSSGTDSTAVDGIFDQTARGEQLPSAEANRLGATSVNANAEMSWPGTIGGEKLGAVVVNLQGVDKGRVTLGGGKKGEGSWVNVPITNTNSFLVHQMLEPVGKHSHESLPKSGSIRFDFDKEWIGAKGEAELLHYHITTALTNLPAQSEERAAPQSGSFQLGSGTTQQGVAGTEPAGLGREVFTE